MFLGDKSDLKEEEDKITVLPQRLLYGEIRAFSKSDAAVDGEQRVWKIKKKHLVHYIVIQADHYIGYSIRLLFMINCYYYI